jgi:hypothetical protein
MVMTLPLSFFQSRDDGTPLLLVLGSTDKQCAVLVDMRVFTDDSIPIDSCCWPWLTNLEFASDKRKIKTFCFAGGKTRPAVNCDADLIDMCRSQTREMRDVLKMTKDATRIACMLPLYELSDMEETLQSTTVARDDLKRCINYLCQKKIRYKDASELVYFFQNFHKTKLDDDKDTRLEHSVRVTANMLSDGVSVSSEAHKQRCVEVLERIKAKMRESYKFGAT